MATRKRVVVKKTDVDGSKKGKAALKRKVQSLFKVPKAKPLLTDRQITDVARDIRVEKELSRGRKKGLVKSKPVNKTNKQRLAEKVRETRRKRK